MTIEEAIELLYFIHDAETIAWSPPHYEALQLGIKALEAWREHRGTGSLMSPLLLLGETVE